MTDWKAALAEEVQFWAKVLAEGGGPWPEEHRMKMDPDAPLHPGIRRWIAEPLGETVEILDVGAGPLTILGKRWPGQSVRITAVDPLAGEYDRILTEQGISPPVRTIYGDALHLKDQLGQNRFDLVFCRNAMDHCPDPIGGIRNCLHAVKPGKYVLLNHFSREAVNQQYQQLHQWNFDKEEDQFVIWNRDVRLIVNDAVRDLADDVYCAIKSGNWHIAALRKRA